MPQTALVLDLGGHTAAQLGYALYLALTTKSNTFSVKAVNAVMMATDVHEVEGPNGALPAHLEMLATRQTNALPIGDA